MGWGRGRWFCLQFFQDTRFTKRPRFRSESCSAVFFWVFLVRIYGGGVYPLPLQENEVHPPPPLQATNLENAGLQTAAEAKAHCPRVSPADVLRRGPVDKVQVDRCLLLRLPAGQEEHPGHGGRNTPPQGAKRQLRRKGWTCLQAFRHATETRKGLERRRGFPESWRARGIGGGGCTAALTFWGQTINGWNKELNSFSRW